MIKKAELVVDIAAMDFKHISTKSLDNQNNYTQKKIFCSGNAHDDGTDRQFHFFRKTHK